MPTLIRPFRIACVLLLLALCTGTRVADAQTQAAARQSAAQYSLSVSVDEVSLSFHAADAHGLPVNDLKLGELSLLDNGKPPEKILAFGPLRDFPIRAGILMDTSVSVAEYSRATVPLRVNTCNGCCGNRPTRRL